MDVLTLIFIFILGTAIGSFLNVLVDRLPQEHSIMGRSHCDHCHKTLEAIDLIPVLSFAVFGGRCRRCQQKLSWQYPVSELITGAVFLLVFLFVGPAPITITALIMKLGYLVVFSSILVILFADIKYQIIPDSMQLSLLAGFVIVKGALYWPNIWYIVTGKQIGRAHV